MLRDYVDLARPDHGFKNVFMLPGIVLGWIFQSTIPSGLLALEAIS